MPTKHGRRGIYLYKEFQHHPRMLPSTKNIHRTPTHSRCPTGVSSFAVRFRFGSVCVAVFLPIVLCNVLGKSALPFNAQLLYLSIDSIAILNLKFHPHLVWICSAAQVRARGRRKPLAPRWRGHTSTAHGRQEAVRRFQDCIL